MIDCLIVKQLFSMVLRVYAIFQKFAPQADHCSLGYFRTYMLNTIQIGQHFLIDTRRLSLFRLNRKKIYENNFF